MEQYGLDFNHMPRVLRCGHTFCTRCLTKLMTPKGVKCPMCTSVHPLDQPNVLHLPPHYAVMQILKTSDDRTDPDVRRLPEPDCEYCKQMPAEKVCIDYLSRASLGPEATVNYRGNEHAGHSRRFLICTEVLLAYLLLLPHPNPCYIVFFS